MLTPNKIQSYQTWCPQSTQENLLPWNENFSRKLNAPQKHISWLEKNPILKTPPNPETHFMIREKTQLLKLLQIHHRYRKTKNKRTPQNQKQKQRKTKTKKKTHPWEKLLEDVESWGPDRWGWWIQTHLNVSGSWPCCRCSTSEPQKQFHWSFSRPLGLSHAWLDPTPWLPLFEEGFSPSLSEPKTPPQTRPKTAGESSFSSSPSPLSFQLFQLENTEREREAKKYNVGWF